MTQVFNFSSGPAMLPADVLKLAQQDLRDWNGLGTSVMEISHRGKEFIQSQRKQSRIFAISSAFPPTTKCCSAMAVVAVSSPGSRSIF